MKVAVIGAGPAGMTAAYVLAKEGVDVEVFESSASVGGLAKTIDLWGQRVDLGPHRFFSKDARVNRVWLEVVGRDYRIVNRLTRIYYKGRFFAYPIKAFDALGNLGVWEAVRCTASYARSRVAPPKDDGTFESWVVSRFGRRLFEIFFKTYSEKLWGIPCTELDADFAAQRIKKLSFLEAVKGAIASRRASKKHRTLVDEFAYPTGGTGAVYERMAAEVARRGGRVRTSTPVQRVVTKSGRVTGVELEGGSFQAFDRVVSTMPITHLVDRLPEAPQVVRDAARSLEFRNTVLVYLKVEATDTFPDNWLYVHAPELKTGRITNFRNWVPELYGDDPGTILALEYWCSESDDLWRMSEADLGALAEREIRATGLVGAAPVSATRVVRVPRCYPVYARGYKDRLKPVQSYLSSVEGLSVIGRYGAFKYNNQDHSILMGLLAAENLLKDARHDLWAVNTDFEDYQEAAVITATGLAPA